MPGIQTVKARRLRATKIDGCGKPLAGSRNRLVTSGFVTLTLTAVMKEAADLTQENAEGKICFEDRTPPERRWYTPALELCNVNTELLTLFTGWEELVDADTLPIGFRDQREIESDYGVALELWTAGKMDDDCAEIPTTDAGLADTGTGRSFGYFLFGGTEWTPGDLTFGATVSTFTLTGRTIALPSWGRGPYNVQDIAGVASRLAQPTSKKEHVTAFRTKTPPPDETNGRVALATSTLFVDPDFYYGGPSNEPAADVAPEQGSATGAVFSLTGTPTGGTMGLKVNGNEAAITATSTASAAKALLVALDDGYDASDFTVTGGPLPGTPLTISTTFDADFELGTNALTGGTSPAGHLA